LCGTCSDTKQILRVEKFTFGITRATVGDMTVFVTSMALLFRAVPVAVTGARQSEHMDKEYCMALA